MNPSLIELAKKIRRFEFNLIHLHREGKIKQSLHLCIGQELDEVELISQLIDGDVVMSNHRSHGHYLAWTGDFKGLKDEILGLPTGCNGGKCGSQHLHHPSPREFYSTGVQGGLVPIAVGMASAFKRRGSDNIVVCFIGDGTLGQGVVYESLNLSRNFDLPIVFVVENNLYAMSTKTNLLPQMIRDRFAGFGIYVDEAMVPNINRTMMPRLKILMTYRFCPHSMSDSDLYRPLTEKQYWMRRDRLEGYMLDQLHP